MSSRYDNSDAFLWDWAGSRKTCVLLPAFGFFFRNLTFHLLISVLWYWGSCLLRKWYVFPCASILTYYQMCIVFVSVPSQSSKFVCWFICLVCWFTCPTNDLSWKKYLYDISCYTIFFSSSDFLMHFKRTNHRCILKHVIVFIRRLNYKRST